MTTEFISELKEILILLSEENKINRDIKNISADYEGMIISQLAY